MVIGGLTTLLWDGHLMPRVKRFRARRRHNTSPEGFTEDTAEGHVIPLEENSSEPDAIHRRINATSLKQPVEAPSTATAESSTYALRDEAMGAEHASRG